MVTDGDMSKPVDPRKTDALQAEARGERPYEPERDDSVVDRIKGAADNLVGGDDYQDHGVSEPEL